MDLRRKLLTKGDKEVLALQMKKVSRREGGKLNLGLSEEDEERLAYRIAVLVEEAYAFGKLNGIEMIHDYAEKLLEYGDHDE